MHLDLTIEQARALHRLLDRSLGELSHEIAATDNAAFRGELSDYRDCLVAVAEAITRLVAEGPEVSPLAPAPGLARELAHPGA
jgi:hypothetical protein